MLGGAIRSPFIDMGIIEVGEQKHFKVRVKNFMHHNMQFKLYFAESDSLGNGKCNCVSINYTMPGRGIGTGLPLEAILS